MLSFFSEKVEVFEVWDERVGKWHVQQVKRCVCVCVCVCACVCALSDVYIINNI